MITADGTEDIAITGAGMLDGNSPAYVTERGEQIHRCPHRALSPSI